MSQGRTGIRCFPNNGSNGGAGADGGGHPLGGHPGSLACLCHDVRRGGGEDTEDDFVGGHRLCGCDPADADGRLGRPAWFAESGSRRVCHDMLPSDGGAVVEAARAHPNRVAAMRHGGNRSHRGTGATICKYGTTTQETCGVVREVDDDRFSVAMTADHGDSGAPIYQRLDTQPERGVHLVGTVIAEAENHPGVIICTSMTSITNFLSKTLRSRLGTVMRNQLETAVEASPGWTSGLRPDII
jgi:hypothetical protein